MSIEIRTLVYVRTGMCPLNTRRRVQCTPCTFIIENSLENSLLCYWHNAHYSGRVHGHPSSVHLFISFYLPPLPSHLFYHPFSSNCPLPPPYHPPLHLSLLSPVSPSPFSHTLVRDTSRRLSTALRVGARRLCVSPHVASRPLCVSLRVASRPLRTRPPVRYSLHCRSDASRRPSSNRRAARQRQRASFVYIPRLFRATTASPLRSAHPPPLPPRPATPPPCQLPRRFRHSAAPLPRLVCRVALCGTTTETGAQTFPPQNVSSNFLPCKARFTRNSIHPSHRCFLHY